MVKLRSYFPLATLLDLLLICAGFASLAYLNREWLLDDFGNVDKWIYTAFFLHYDIPSVLADDKKIARLPWVLSGFALHRMFTPIVAAQILHGGYFLLSCTGVYIAIKKLLDRSVALLTALFCLFCVELHGPGGWDYHDLAGGAFYLFSYVALASAAETQKRPFMPFFAAGILLALTAHTNIISINLFPVFAIEVVAALKRRNFIFSQNKAWLTTASAGVFLGAAACTIALGLINLGAGRQFFFFSRLLQVSQELLLDPSLQQPWWRDWSSLWWAKETDMALYGGVLVLAVPVLAYTAVKRRAVWSDVTTVLLIEYVLGFAVLLGWQIAGQTALQPDYMAYPLMFPMIFALAALIAKVLPRAGPRAFAVSWFCGIAFAIYLLFGDAVERVVVNPLAQTACVLLGRNDLHAVLPFLLLICGLGAVIVLVSYLPRPSGRLRGAYLILFPCVAAVLAATDKEAANARGVVFQNQCVVRRPVYASIIESNRYLFREVNGAYRVHLWFSPNELIGGTNCQVRVPAWTVGQPLIFGGVDSLMPSDEMPNTVASVPIDALKVLNPRAEVVAVISQTSTPAVELAEKLSKSSDSTWRVLQSKKVAHGPVAFLISIIGDAQEARAGAQHL